MSALPYPKYGLDKLYLFPYYQTREAYEQATGQPCPAWDPSRRPKKWLDPNADASEDFVMYPRVLATNMREGGQALVGTDGNPYLKSLALPTAVAASVNIAPNTANIPGADTPEYPVPVRALESNEQLFFDVLAVVTVRNTDFVQPTGSGGFTPQDRALLQAIAKKLGL